MNATKLFRCPVFFACLLCTILSWSVAYAADDTFNAMVDAKGQVVQGGGSGYQSGSWFYYRNSNWWNQWFYNGRLEIGRDKRVELFFKIAPYEPGLASSVTVAINWSTTQWPSGQQRPPLPADVAGDGLEDQYIDRYIVYEGSVKEATEIGRRLTLSGYCPEWVSIDIRGQNVILSEGSIKHECLEPEPETQACCFADGQCRDLTPDECRRLNGTPQGTGTECSSSACPVPTQACCLPDGTCIDESAENCKAKGGIPQGTGSDCTTADCGCIWEPGDLHKMHWPQRPKTGGWDIEFGGSVLADDWGCTESGPVEDIHFWISWMDNQVQSIGGFKITIYSDIPDPDRDGPAYSMPGQALWSKEFASGDFLVHDMPSDLQSWFDPSTGEYLAQDHRRWQQIDICTLDDPFIQKEGTIYWLAVDFGQLPFVGWKQSGSDHFNDDAVWLLPGTQSWNELRDPITGRSLDLSFVITGGQPSVELEFGDAPEGSLAYPDICVTGRFPTCVSTGPAAWIQHKTNKAYLGPQADLEADGNAGLCPLFTPNVYNQDECFQDGDAGLIIPAPFTIQGPAGQERVVPCVQGQAGALGQVCSTASWGTNVDIEVHNHLLPVVTGAPSAAYMNVLLDWNRDGAWGGTAAACATAAAPEHVLVNFPIPSGYDGPLSSLNPPDFLIGPWGGYCWARFTISEQPVSQDWDGAGQFEDGETEDYLLYVRREKNPVECDWSPNEPAKMHWAQLPDLDPTGIDVAVLGNRLADDFQCTESGPITDIHIWGSFANDCLPLQGVDGLTFRLTLYSDIPANANRPWSMPGQTLWSQVFGPGQYSVRRVGDGPEGWYDPATGKFEPANHHGAYQYNFCIDDPYVQEQGVIYWLEVQTVLSAVPGTTLAEPPYHFGWKTTSPELHFNDDAVWLDINGNRQPLEYPENHAFGGQTLDLAFVITGSGTPVHDLDFGDAPDTAAAAGYPTFLANNGARHLIVPRLYLGSLIDAEVDGQPDATATGDDLAMTDDEDGVTFASLLQPGHGAQVEVIASAPGFLNAWLDFNRDGDWSDPGEQVYIDTPLTAGTNSLALVVPAGSSTGLTFARFRFSTAKGLDYDGWAPDGEVEDYPIRISEPNEPGPLQGDFKWSQPPIEYDPRTAQPRFCGWDELSYAKKAASADIAVWKVVADDFRCIGEMPVTSIHWWGSYEGWMEDIPPALQPDQWRIAFWANVPANSSTPFSRPGRLLHQFVVLNATVAQEAAGMDQFPQKPTDTCFKYALQLDPDQYFWQEQYITADNPDRIFWISITALYSQTQPDHLWGWKTRPWPWMDTAVTFTVNQTPASGAPDLTIGPTASGFTPDAADIHPIENALVCNVAQPYDMAFKLDTDPNYVKWQQGFTGLRQWSHYEDVLATQSGSVLASDKWIQEPDLERSGLDVDCANIIPPIQKPIICADDYQCTATGPVTQIVIWTSWLRDIVSSGDPCSVEFVLSLRSDIPASQSTTGYSMPGQVLWSRTFPRGDYRAESLTTAVQGYYNPVQGSLISNNHTRAYKYTFTIDPDQAFTQKGTTDDPVVYWLSVQAVLRLPAGTSATSLGWKTSKTQWNDQAVWVQAQEPYNGSWQKLNYPPNQDIGMAFAITTGQEQQTPTCQAADDFLCETNTPVTAAVWWGSYLGYQYAACDCTVQFKPPQPDYFLLSIWTDVPDPDPTDGTTGSHPGQMIWSYKAAQYDEVLVGFDKYPEAADDVRPREPVFRYSVRLPREHWFFQQETNTVFWFSVVAVYEDASSMFWPWGWTNHPYGFNDFAVQRGCSTSAGAIPDWSALYDQTGAGEDLSFILFTQPAPVLGEPISVPAN